MMHAYLAKDTLKIMKLNKLLLFFQKGDSTMAPSNLLVLSKSYPLSSSDKFQQKFARNKVCTPLNISSFN